MNQNEIDDRDRDDRDRDADEMTLDPPGSIAVVGAGPLGIEAALYGRFLGYDVTLIEAAEVAGAIGPLLDEPLSMMPHQCLSPLAISALQAQSSQSLPLQLPVTFRQWVEDALHGLIECDLLAGRLRHPVRVTRIEFAPAPNHEAPSDSCSPDHAELQERESDEAESEEPPPPDFRLHLIDETGQPNELVAEAVIIATGETLDIELGFSLPADYYFRIGDERHLDLGAALTSGRQQIVSVFAQLGGRADLDLYRPRRG